MSAMIVFPIKTPIFQAREDLGEFILQNVSKEHIHEKMIIVVTSKIVSLAEGKLIPAPGVDKASLVRKEADEFLGDIGYGCFLTVKHGLLIPSAGIDESNSQSGDYILYPEDPFLSTRRLWQFLKERWQLKSLGVLMTDSHTTPLRRGVTGIALSYWGFSGLRKLVGQCDLFGRQLKMTNMNLADGLAAASTLMMGESDESQPLAVISGAPVEFMDEISKDEVSIPLEEDLYYPLLKGLIKDRLSST